MDRLNIYVDDQWNMTIIEYKISRRTDEDISDTHLVENPIDQIKFKEDFLNEKISIRTKQGTTSNVTLKKIWKDLGDSFKREEKKHRLLTSQKHISYCEEILYKRIFTQEDYFCKPQENEIEKYFSKYAGLVERFRFFKKKFEMQKTHEKIGKYNVFSIPIPEDNRTLYGYLFLSGYCIIGENKVVQPQNPTSSSHHSRVSVGVKSTTKQESPPPKTLYQRMMHTMKNFNFGWKSKGGGSRRSSISREKKNTVQ